MALFWPGAAPHRMTYPWHPPTLPKCWPEAGDPRGRREGEERGREGGKGKGMRGWVKAPSGHRRQTRARGSNPSPSRAPRHGLPLPS